MDNQPKIINAVITSFRGLGLPIILSIPIDASVTIGELQAQLSDRLPQVKSRLSLTTTSNKEVSGLSSRPLYYLLSDYNDDFLPLRLSAGLCGGKGGFGSQLRAAGGRMSSRRKKTQGDSNSSNRNLDGRRLRTVAEAKALAEYLALKPVMEEKENEARRNRWERVVELVEKREAELKNGSKGRVGVQWMEDKEEAEEKTRDAVLNAVRSGKFHDNLTGDSVPGLDHVFMDKGNSAPEGAAENASHERFGSATELSRAYYGFDYDDESSEDDDWEEE
jgi:hypothetical protein